jgi:hypothetical protein
LGIVMLKSPWLAKRRQSESPQEKTDAWFPTYGRSD